MNKTNTKIIGQEKEALNNRRLIEHGYTSQTYNHTFKCADVTVYLQFIVDAYNILPDFTAFVIGTYFTTAHQGNLHDRIFENEYNHFNLRTLDDRVWDVELLQDTHFFQYFNLFYENILEPSLGKLHTYRTNIRGQSKLSQFIVHRNIIRMQPRETYEQMLNWCIEHEDYGIEVMACAWNFIFGRHNKISSSTTSPAIPRHIFLTHRDKKPLARVAECWRLLNPSHIVYTFDDADCLLELSPHQQKIFLSIIDGPIRCDYFRVCILQKRGGVYADADIVPLIPLSEFIDPKAHFVSTMGESGTLNPHFIACEANDAVISACVKQYDYFHVNQKPYCYWGWSIVPIMTQVVREIDLLRDARNSISFRRTLIYQFLEEKFATNNHPPPYDAGCIFGEKLCLYNRSMDYDAINHNFAGYITKVPEWAIRNHKKHLHEIRVSKLKHIVRQVYSQKCLNIL
jgi:mannosyltransferase OCH1-like enzyme